MQPAAMTGFTGIRSTDEWISNPSVSVEERRLLPIAHEYISSLNWMRRPIGFWHGLSTKDLVGVFLYQIVPPKEDIPQYHWIIVGPKWPYPIWNENKVDENAVRNLTYTGVPHAYIWAGTPHFTEPDDAPNPACALASYCNVIDSWCDTVFNAGDLKTEFPVGVPEGKDSRTYALDVRSKIRVIRETVLPTFREQIIAGGWGEQLEKRPR